MFENNDCAVNE